jgi:hypothetical protein
MAVKRPKLRPKSHTIINGMEVVYYDHPTRNTVIRVVRPVLPDPRIARWANSIKREDVRGLTRTIPKGLIYPRGAPLDPHATWIIGSVPVFGVNPEVIPDVIDLHSPRVGRAFLWHSDDGHSVIPLVVFPADPTNVLCPPYPGVRPIEIDDPWHPSTCFSDGCLAKWDPRFYPQLYESRRPWLGYHRSPRPDFWRYEHKVERPHDVDWLDPRWKDYSRSAVHHYLPVTEFFEWTRPSQPDKGGHWRRELFADLFVTRSYVEGRVLFLLEDLMELDPDFRMDEFQLPWYDELGYDAAITWTTWQEGRDALGRTCRYIAELEAICHWLQTMSAVHRNYPTRDNPPCSSYDFIGTWATTFRTKEEWMMLHRGFVPIYVISELPSSHPSALEGLEHGELDGGERYRTNRFDAQHNMPNLVGAFPKYTFPSTMALRRSVLPLQDLPTQICSPEKIKDLNLVAPYLLLIVQYDPSPRTASYLPWTSYLFNHPLAMKQSVLDKMECCNNRWTLSYKTLCLDLFYFIAPADGILDIDQDTHPFFWVCDQTEESSDTHYEEFYDETLQYWYFRRVRGSSLTKTRRLPYAFSYPQSNVTIHSLFPFPGRSPLVGRVGNTHSEYSTPHQTIRKYFMRRLRSSAQSSFARGLLQADFTWTPAEADIDSLENAACDIQLGNFESFPDQVMQSETFHSDEQLEPVEVTSLEHRIERLKSQRINLQAQIERRLFKPIKGDNLRANFVVPWQPLDASAFVWPLRIAGLHGSTSIGLFLSMLSTRYSVYLNNILLICSYQELDLSRTVDLGLRYAEDALWLWVVLHGSRVDDHLLEVYPLKALRGAGSTVESSASSNIPQHGFHDRAQRMEDLIVLQELWPLHSNLSVQELLGAASILCQQGNNLQTHSTEEPIYPGKLLLSPVIMQMLTYLVSSV